MPCISPHLAKYTDLQLDARVCAGLHAQHACSWHGWASDADRERRGAHLEVEHKPGCDSLSHDIHEEVGKGKQPDELVGQHIFFESLHHASLGLGGPCQSRALSALGPRAANMHRFIACSRCYCTMWSKCCKGKLHTEHITSARELRCIQQHDGQWSEMQAACICVRHAGEACARLLATTQLSSQHGSQR